MAERMKKMKIEAAERKEMKQGPHLLLMMDNPLTSGLYPTALPEGETVAGKAAEAQLKLRGTGVRPTHAVFTNVKGKVTIVPQPKAVSMCNGVALKQSRVLKNNDRLRFAQDNYYRFIDPAVNDQLTEEERESNEVKTLSASLRHFSSAHTHEVLFWQVKYSFQFMKEEAMQLLMQGRCEAWSEDVGAAFLLWLAAINLQPPAARAAPRSDSVSACFSFSVSSADSPPTIPSLLPSTCFAGFKIDEENETVRMNMMAKELKEREHVFQQQQKKLMNSHKNEIEKHEQQMRQLEQKLLKDKVGNLMPFHFMSSRCGQSQWHGAL